MDTLAGRLQAVLDQVWAIRLDWQDPERFHLARSEAIGSLKALINEAGIAQAGTPAITKKAKAALRLLEATNVPVVAAVEITEAIDIAESTSGEAPVPLPAESASPLAETPSRHADLVELERSISRAAAALTTILADIEKLALAARASVASYASALILPPRPAPQESPVAVTTLREPLPVDPETFYRRSFLLTDEGRAIAASLWVDGLSKRDIAECFDYRDSNGPACVSAAIATFLRLHCQSEHWIITGEDGKDAVRQALRSIGFKPGQPLHAPTSITRRSNGHGVGIDTPVELVGDRRKLAQRCDVGFAPAPQEQLDRAMLNLDTGRALAVELWVNGTIQAEIGTRFGYLRHHGASPISQAIAGFLRQYADHGWLNAFGEKRKVFARTALQRFRAANGGTDHPASDPARIGPGLPAACPASPEGDTP
jgi:hypothetical protein